LEQNHPLLAGLKSLTEDLALSVSAGDVILLQGNWYVTHAGLLRIAKRNRCAGMKVQFIRGLSDSAASRFAFEATVFKSKTCQGFVDQAQKQTDGPSCFQPALPRRHPVLREYPWPLQRASQHAMLDEIALGLRENLRPTRKSLGCSSRESKGGSCLGLDQPSHHNAGVLAG
jgi:hypothetical protein